MDGEWRVCWWRVGSVWVEGGEYVGGGWRVCGWGVCAWRVGSVWGSVLVEGG